MMQKKGLILIMLLLGVSFSMKAQYLFPTHFESCNTSQFALEGKEIYAEKDSKILLNEILQGIDANVLRKAKGEIWLQVLVDTMGTPCLISLDNKLRGKIKRTDFKTIIDNQTNWICPMDEGNKVTACVLIQLVFTKNRVELRRIGFNSKVGRILLDTFVLEI